MTENEEHEYVYAIGHPHGFVKIGRSSQPQQRLKDHQVSCPHELWIIAQFPVNDSRAVENELHEMLADKQERGEWYKLGYEDYDNLFEMVGMAASEHDFESIDAFRAWQTKKRVSML